MNDVAVVPLTPEVLRALAELRDLQPEASGWGSLPWWLAGLLVALGLLARYWWRRPRQRLARQLRRWREDYRRGAIDPAAGARLAPATAAALAGLLRQTACRTAMPPGLAGDDWLCWLDERAPAADRGAFAGGVGVDLLHLPFVGPDLPGFDPARVDALFALTARWLRANA